MKPISAPTTRESGLALITVVALMAVMSIMAIAFSLAIRNEEQAVRNYAHFATVQDVSNAGIGVARAFLGDSYFGPDGIANSGDENLLVDSLEDPWAGGFADVLNRVEGLRMVYNARRQLLKVDPVTAVPVEGNFYSGLNRPFTLGVDEDPYGDRNGDGAPGILGVDDDGDGGTDWQDPEVRAAIAGGLTYEPAYDDDEDGMMDEDGPDFNFNPWYAVGLGIDMDGDRVGVFDEGSKIHLNYTGNIVAGGDYAHMYGDGVTTFEINPAMLLYDRLSFPGTGVSDPDGVLVGSPVDAARYAGQIVEYLYGGGVGGGGTAAPGLPGVDDNFNFDTGMLGDFLVRVGVDESPHMGNEGDRADNNFDGVADDVREYPINIDGIDNDGDGDTDEIGEGIDEPFEFTTRPPDLLRRTGVLSGGLLSDDRTYETGEAVKLAAGGQLGAKVTLTLNQGGVINSYIPTTVPELRDELSRREMAPFDFIRDYVTVYSTAPQQMVSRGFARDRINPNTTSNLIPLLSRQSVDSLFPIAIDNDGDWQAEDELDVTDGIDNDGDGLTDERSDDHNRNRIPDGNWDGAAEMGLVRPDGSPGPANDGIDNDRDGLTDNLPESDDGYEAYLLYDDGDINRDGIANYDPEWHVDEDPPGDANGDGQPGIGFDNPLLQAVFDDEEMRQLADDDGDGGIDYDDPQVRAAMEDPQNDGVDNNWNSPVWLYDGIDNDGDGLTDERANEFTGQKDEGVDEPGEWYIPAFDDDEDGRMDEDPPEFQFLFNLADAIDRPIPSVNDMPREPRQRVDVPRAPDPPQSVRNIPRYSFFHVRSPLVSTNAGGHRERLETIREALSTEDPDLQQDFSDPYAARDKVAYRGGEAIRINEVMIPFTRIWAPETEDGDELVEVIVNTELDDDDDIYPPSPPAPPSCAAPPPQCDRDWPAWDDYWHPFAAQEESDPLNGAFWVVHNSPRVTYLDDVTPRVPNSETLTATIQGIPEGVYEARYVSFPLQVGTGLSNIQSVNGAQLDNSVDGRAGEIRVLHPTTGVVLGATDIPTGPVARVIRLPDITVLPDYSNGIRVQVEIFAYTNGEFGFTCLELYDPDQQYVELINLTKGERPVVLNGAGGDDTAWSLRIEPIVAGQISDGTDIMLQGAVYSSDNPHDPETRGENISLVTRTGQTRSDLTTIRSTLRNNFDLDLTRFSDQLDSLGSIPEMETTALTRFQNLFLTSVPPTDDATADLDIFRGEDLFSSSDSIVGDLRVGGNAEARISLMALEDPDDESSSRFTVDQVRVVANTKGRQYRGFQSSERDDPFSGVYEIRTVEGDGGETQRRLTRVRQFTRLDVRDALAVADLDLTPAPTGYFDGAVHPGSPRWVYKVDSADASGGYLATADEVTGADLATFYWVVDNLIPSAGWISVRIYGKGGVDYDENTVLGSVRVRTGPGDDDFVETEAVRNGEVVAAHLDPDNLPRDVRGRRIFELQIRNTATLAEVDTDPLPDTSFKYLEIATAGSMEGHDDPSVADDALPLLGGTAGRTNGTYVYSPDAPEHWDGMMPNAGRVAFISTGQPFRPLTLDETAKVVPYLTTHFDRDVPGLINVNTAPRPVLLCLPWAQPPYNRTMDQIAFRRIYEFANLMAMAVTNARQEMGLSPSMGTSSSRAPNTDDDSDGFTDEEPYRTTGDLIRAIRAIRWVFGNPTYEEIPVIDWPSFRLTITGRDLVMDEFAELFGDPSLTDADIGLGSMNRLEKEIFARVSNLICVRSNMFEIGTRGRVVTDDGQVLAEAFAVQVLDRRF